MSKFEDFISKIIAPDVNLEELQNDIPAVVEEVKEQQTQIADLSNRLTESQNNYQSLQSRIVDNLFNNKSSDVKEEPEKKEPERKTFKDIIGDNPWLKL